MMIAQGFFDFGLSEHMLHIVQIIAAVGGAVVGWFLTDPLTRLLYRLSFRAAVPGTLLFASKGAGGAALAAVMYFLAAGGGGGGIGFGPGKGGIPGKGPGNGGDKADLIAKDGKTVTDDKKKDPVKSADTLEPVDIEIVSVLRDQDVAKKRFFLVAHKNPALAHDELDDYLKKNRAKIEVTPVLTDDSIGTGGDNNPLSQLLALTKKYAVKTLATKTP